jgi:O-antigen ligase
MVIFDRIIEYGIIVLIVFTPLAFGSVHLWAYTTMEITICILVIIWILKLITVNLKKTPAIQYLQSNQQISESLPDSEEAGQILGPYSAEHTLLGQHLQSPTSRFPLSVNRFGFVKTPLNIPIMVFIALIVFQLIPLPPGVIKFLSPNTYHLYREVLPEWPVERPPELSTPGSGNPPDLNTASADLISGKANQESKILTHKPLLSKRQGFSSNWMPISIYPYATKTEFFKILAYIGMFFLVTNTPNLRINRIIVVIIGVGFFISLVGILQKLTGTTNIYWVRDASYAVPFGPYINRNHFAGYIGMVILLAFGLLISRFTDIASYRTVTRRSMSAEFQSHLFTNFLLIFIITIMISALFLSLSRGGIISFIVGMVVFVALISFSRTKVVISRGRSIIFTVLTLTLILLIWLGLGPIFDRFSDLSAPTRYELYQDTISMAKDFPTFGTGLGTFQYLYPRYRTVHGQFYIVHTENDYLEHLTDNGLFGFMIVLGGIILFFRKTLTVWWERRDPYARGVTLGGVCGVIAILIHSFVDFNLHIPANALFTALTFGLIYNAVNFKGIQAKHN